MYCKVEEHIGDLHSKIDKILCLIDPSDEGLIDQAVKLQKYLNLGVNLSSDEFIEIQEDYPRFNIYRTGTKFIVTVKGDHYA